MFKSYDQVFFKISYFLNPSINLKYDCYVERYWSEILFGINSTSWYDLEAKDYNILHLTKGCS